MYISYVYFSVFCRPYGAAGNKMCGICHDVKTCNHVNGTCLTGCDAGYWGSLCKTREYCITSHLFMETCVH